MNVVNLIGYVGQEPELRRTNNTGQAVVNLAVATRETFTDKEGKEVKRTEWHKVVCWGKVAEQVAVEIHQGDRLGVEGKLQTRKWRDARGNNRETVEITALRVHVEETY